MCIDISKRRRGKLVPFKPQGEVSAMMRSESLRRNTDYSKSVQATNVVISSSFKSFLSLK